GVATIVDGQSTRSAEGVHVEDSIEPRIESLTCPRAEWERHTVWQLRSRYAEVLFRVTDNVSLVDLVVKEPGEIGIGRRFRELTRAHRIDQHCERRHPKSPWMVGQDRMHDRRRQIETASDRLGKDDVGPRDAAGDRRRQRIGGAQKIREAATE